MTISIGAIQSFDQFLLETATRIVYDEIIPRCEAKGIKLSNYGNHASVKSIDSVERYDTDKQNHTLFNIERIQRAFKYLDEVIAKATVESVGSYGLKHVVERHQGEYITNEDCIIAMIAKGYIAHFGSEGLHMNCQFNITHR